MKTFYYVACEFLSFCSLQVYSNTPTDFDFKLESLAQGFRSLSDFAEHLAASVDIVFPVIHGRFGEDGGIQELLEKSNIPFVGTRSNECRQAFDKDYILKQPLPEKRVLVEYDSSLELDRQGFVTLPNFLVQGSHSNESELSKWFAENHLDTNSGKVVVKPTRAGSSIGVTVAYGVADSLKKQMKLLQRVLVEIFLEGGSEFTAIVLDVGSGFDCHPVVLLPTEEINSKYKTFVANLSNETILRNVEEALKDTKWKEAINEEIKALLKNNTWEVVDLPKEKNTVGLANNDWPWQQLDVKNAFLHGNLEEVFIDSPLDFENHFGVGGKLTILIMYVDNTILISNDVEEMTMIKLKLAKEFEIKDLGNLRYFLGIEVARSKKGIYVSQRKYILDFLNEIGMLGCKPEATTINPNHKLGIDPSKTPVDKGWYQRLVGKLIYLSHTRPDIAYVVGLVEIQLHDNADMREKDAIFNYRRKYLPTQQVAYHTPPRFPMDVIGSIREGASLLFQRLGLHDFARIDGWFLPSSIHIPSASEKKLGRTKSGTVIFTDINLISGMEQTSFLFQQASKVGFSHSNILRSIIQRACLRFPNLASYTSLSNLLPRRSKSSQLIEAFPKTKDVRKVFVIFGGDTSERQVSLMSGTNVWLNLQAFNDVSSTTEDLN
ncbi:Retrovirus-related Pol polyprotein from transposon RE1 [Vitis vinifera]|uniref:Retrovirus-related Pol polyprotein from transposon RE1 n=1 Tax=Vitis vinifera TaxID=29760 RepID=A0A438GRM2_VITVI|nr:Retrovirus-related Pol polyprotein from transposon RE1 [Vitis vinifera]